MLLTLTIARLFTGDFLGARAAVERGLALARRTRQGLLTPAFVCVRGFVDQELGRLESAQADQEEALDSALLSGNVQVAYWASIESSVLALQRGRDRGGARARPGRVGAARHARVLAGRVRGRRRPAGGRRPCGRARRRSRRSGGCARRCGRSTASRPPTSPCACCSRSDASTRRRPGPTACRSRAAAAAPASSAPSPPARAPPCCWPTGAPRRRRGSPRPARRGRGRRARAGLGRALPHAGGRGAGGRRAPGRRARAAARAPPPSSTRSARSGSRDAALQGAAPARRPAAAAGVAARPPATATTAAWRALSPREREVADARSPRGRTNAQIAHRLHLSERTVEKHVSNLLAQARLAHAGAEVVRADRERHRVAGRPPATRHPPYRHRRLAGSWSVIDHRHRLAPPPSPSACSPPRSGALELYSVYLGAELGLYRRSRRTARHAGRARGARRHRTALRPRVARAAGRRRAARRRATRPRRAERAATRSPPTTPACSPTPTPPPTWRPFAHMLAGIGGVLGRVAEAYRTGGGVPYAELRQRLPRTGRARSTAPPSSTSWPTTGCPAMPDVVARLRGARPRAWPTSAAGRAGRRSPSPAPSSTRRRRHRPRPGSIAGAGATPPRPASTPRCASCDADAAGWPSHGPYDLVLGPRGPARHGPARRGAPRRARPRWRRRDGARRRRACGRRFTAPGDDVERLMYGWSVTHCLPDQHGRAAVRRPRDRHARRHRARRSPPTPASPASTCCPSSTTSSASTASTFGLKEVLDKTSRRRNGTVLARTHQHPAVTFTARRRRRPVCRPARPRARRAADRWPQRPR